MFRLRPDNIGLTVYRAGPKIVPMADEPENLVLVYLRRLDEKADGMREDLREVKDRLGSLERQVAGTRVDIADLRNDFVRLEARVDRFDRRIERIERRLDLIEPATPGE